MDFHIITDFTRLEGAQTMLARLLAYSTAARPVVVSLRDVSDEARGKAGNPAVRYHALGITGIGQLPRGLWRLAGLIRQERPPAILCWMYHGAVVGTLAARMSGVGTQVFWTIRQALDDRASMGRASRLSVRAAAVMSRFSKGIIYNSDRARGQHAAAGFRTAKAFVIPNGIEAPAAPDRAHRAPRIFGIAARHHAQKDHPTFLSAATRLLAQYPDAFFKAAGHGMTARNPELAREIRAAGLLPDRLELMGPLTDMGPFYEGIDVLVLSSRTEGFPNVVAEAMSHGAPVVTTDVGDAAKIVAGTGAVVPPRDAPALAGAMADMCALEPEVYADLSRRSARRIRTQYDLATIVARYQAVCDPVGPEWHPRERQA